MIFAHGIGSRGDLPVPTSLAALGAGLAIVISFAVLGLLWRRPRLRGSTAGLPWPRLLGRAADSVPLRILLRGLTLVAALAVCFVGLAGAQTPALNLAPWAFYITFWVGLVPASLLLGPVWRVLNPLRLVHAGLAAVLRLDPDRGAVTLPRAVGYWPAVAALVGFAWFELVYPQGSVPAHVAWFVLVYGAVHTLAALVFGRRWFDRGDGFEAYSALLGSLAPLGRRADGRLVLRNPLDGLDAIRPAPGLVGVIVVLVGSTAYDGLSGTLWWETTVPTGTGIETLALVGAILVIAAIYVLGTASLVGPEARAGPASFAHAIVPIAAGYAIAHYFSLLIFDGQRVVILASDPFATGANLFGTADRVVSYAVVSVTTIALVQVGAIVLGHLVAAVAAHDRAVRLFPAGAAVRVQFPLLAAMVILTIGAVALVFAP